MIKVVASVAVLSLLTCAPAALAKDAPVLEFQKTEKTVSQYLNDGYKVISADLSKVSLQKGDTLVLCVLTQIGVKAPANWAFSTQACYDNSAR